MIDNFIYSNTIKNPKNINESCVMFKDENDTFRGKIIYNIIKDIFIIYGQFLNNKPNIVLEYMAPQKIPQMYSYSGSGLPYPSKDVAFSETMNKGICKTNELGQFIFELYHPNSYYINQGNILVKPHVYIKCGNSEYNLTISDPVPFRSLTSLPNQPNRVQGR